MNFLIFGSACAEPKEQHATAPPVKPSAAEVKAAAAPLKSQIMRGPFSDLNAFCKADKHTPTECFIDAPDQDGGGFFALKNVTAPFKASRVISAGDGGWRQFYLAVQVAKGWYVQEIVSAGADAQVRELTVDQSAPTLGPLIRLRLAVSNLMPAAPHAERTVQYCIEQLALCGMGRSEVPSCIPPLQVANAYCKGYAGDKPMPPWDWEIKLTLQKDGRLDLAAVGSPDFIMPTQRLGAHRLQFP